MDGLILAAGEGSRLKAAGHGTPKPLVEVGGTPQIARLVNSLGRVGCRAVTCMVRDDAPGVLDLLRRGDGGVPVEAYFCRTASSLHTLVEGLGRMPPGEVLATMVDTVMREGDWMAVARAVEDGLAGGAEAVLAVTPFVDDESGVYVSIDGDRRVRGISDAPIEPVLVTGGVYGFAPTARALAVQAVAEGLHRMRAFLGMLVSHGRCVLAVEVPRIIDLDRPSDLAAANAWLGAHGRR